MGRCRVTVVVVIAACLAAVALAQGQDPRTAAGQLAACGGASSWQRIGYLEFKVAITTPQGQLGPWQYRWDRRNGYLRMTGKGLDGADVDVEIDLGSKSGGGWRAGKQVSGKPLADLMNWALQRWGEDVLWLTFPLEWGAPGVTVTPGPEVAGDDGTQFLTTTVKSPTGTWDIRLDPSSGRVVRTVFIRPGSQQLTVSWSDWQPHGNVYFAHRRTIAETGETIDVDVLRADPEAPPNVF